MMSLFMVLQAIQHICADIATSVRRLADAGTGFEARLLPLENRVKELERQQAGMDKLLLVLASARVDTIVRELRREVVEAEEGCHE
jgi:hypothetical protein